MSKQIPKCRFCGADLRWAEVLKRTRGAGAGAATRIIMEEGPRGARRRWGCCEKDECMQRFRELRERGDG
jgi:hypothetical protein